MKRAIAAITEESKKILRVAFPEGANALLNLVRDPEHKEHGRAIALLLERTFPAETRHNVRWCTRLSITIRKPSRSCALCARLVRHAGKID